LSEKLQFIAVTDEEEDKRHIAPPEDEAVLFENVQSVAVIE
jgi:hypothetical protein